PRLRAERAQHRPAVVRPRPEAVSVDHTIVAERLGSLPVAPEGGDVRAPRLHTERQHEREHRNTLRGCQPSSGPATRSRRLAPRARNAYAQVVARAAERPAAATAKSRSPRSAVPNMQPVQTTNQDPRARAPTREATDDTPGSTDARPVAAGDGW